MMIRPGARGARAGITLTEILISIMIMGVGMLALATLFPLGLQRLRDAARSSRSAMLIETATNEVSSRDLLYKPSFVVNGYPHDPFTEDPASAGEATNVTVGLDRISNNPAYAGLRGGTGIPICYDPLWWYQAFLTSGVQPSFTPGAEFRFGSGIGIIRADASGTPSAHGLQRITNFPLIPALGGPVDPASLFCSPDDLVMQSDGTPSPATGRGSPVVPDLSTNSRLYDHSYTWMFTGKQTDSANGTIFDGDVVIFHNRPFAIASVAGQNTAAGETVVEAIWGYSSVVLNGYGRNNRSVLLRWNASLPDPDVRVGGYIADVTYERFNGAEVARFYPPSSTGAYAAQRCFWYRVAKKGDATTDTIYPGYRQMIVTLSSDVRAKTQVVAGTNGATPVAINAALVSPYVVNVVSRVFYSR
jgi:type II secretory pathway pseudopilin PulG